MFTLSECCGRDVKEGVGPMPHTFSADECAHCYYCNTINCGTIINHSTVITVSHVLEQCSDQLCYSNTGKRSNFVGRGPSRFSLRRGLPALSTVRSGYPHPPRPPPSPRAVEGLSRPKARSCCLHIFIATITLAQDGHVRPLLIATHNYNRMQPPFPNTHTAATSNDSFQYHA